MKPDAPLEIRGELKPIRSRLPGLDVCELLPHMAQVMDRTTVVRSMTHALPIHGVAYALTGAPQVELSAELNPRDPRHWPFVGSRGRLRCRNGGHGPETTPQRGTGRKPPRRRADNVALPFPFSSQRVGKCRGRVRTRRFWAAPIIRFGPRFTAKRLTHDQRPSRTKSSMWPSPTWASHPPAGSSWPARGCARRSDLGPARPTPLTGATIRPSSSRPQSAPPPGATATLPRDGLLTHGSTKVREAPRPGPRAVAAS